MRDDGSDVVGRVMLSKVNSGVQTVADQDSDRAARATGIPNRGGAPKGLPDRRRPERRSIFVSRPPEK
jgi:hypothetical protein